MGVYTATTEGAETITTSTETLIQLKGATTAKPKLIAWGVSFFGIDSTAAPIQVDLLRQSTNGTNSGATEVQLDADAAAPAVTAFHSFSAEPTAGNVLEQYAVHPQGGSIVREYPPGREPYISKSASDYLGIRVVSPGAGTTVVAWMTWEE